MIENELEQYNNLSAALRDLKNPNVLSIKLSKYNLSKDSNVVINLLSVNPKYKVINDILIFADKKQDIYDKISTCYSDIEMYERKILFLRSAIDESHEQILKLQKQLRELREQENGQRGST